MNTPGPNPQQRGYTSQLFHRDRIAEHNEQQLLAQAEVGKPATRAARQAKTRASRKASQPRQNGRTRPN